MLCSQSRHQMLCILSDHIVQDTVNMHTAFFCQFSDTSKLINLKSRFHLHKIGKYDIFHHPICVFTSTKLTFPVLGNIAMVNSGVSEDSSKPFKSSTGTLSIHPAEQAQT